MAGKRRKPSDIIAAAVRRGAIPESRAAHYMARAADGEDLAFMDQLWAPPADLRAALARDNGRQPPRTEDDEVFERLYGSAGSQGPGHEALPGHGPVTVQHEHEHSDYAGGQHAHVHSHLGDALHEPGTVGHLHGGSASAAMPSPVYDAMFGTPETRRAAVAEMTEDQLWAAVFGEQ